MIEQLHRMASQLVTQCVARADDRQAVRVSHDDLDPPEHRRFEFRRRIGCRQPVDERREYRAEQHADQIVGRRRHRQIIARNTTLDRGADVVAKARDRSGDRRDDRIKNEDGKENTPTAVGATRVAIEGRSFEYGPPEVDVVAGKPLASEHFYSQTLTIVTKTVDTVTVRVQIGPVDHRRATLKGNWCTRT